MDWSVLVSAAPAGFRGWLSTWAPLAEWFVAGGTLALAGATAFLAWQTRQEARTVREQTEAVRDEAHSVAQQVQLQREQAEASLRPVVFPVVPFDLARGLGRYEALGNKLIVLRNGGPGLALNVHGEVFWRSETQTLVRRAILATTIAAGGTEEAQISEHGVTSWANAMGHLDYRDVTGVEWQTRFRFGLGPGNELHVTVGPIDMRDRLESSEYPSPEWVSGS